MPRGYRLTWSGPLVNPDVAAFRSGLVNYGLTVVGNLYQQATSNGTIYAIPCEEALIIAYRRGTNLYLEILVLTQSIDLAGLKLHVQNTLGLPNVIEDETSL